MRLKWNRALALLLAVLVTLSAAGCKKEEEPSSSEEPTASEPSRKKPSTWTNPLQEPEREPPFTVVVPEENGLQMAEAKKKNGEVVGWLQVPNTAINGPVVQAANNTKYSRMDWDFTPNFDGAYWMDCDDRIGGGARAEMPQNTIIYSHHTGVDTDGDGKGNGTVDNPDGPTFSQLLKFREIEMARQTPYIYLTTAGEDLIYQVFAVIYTEAAMKPVRYIYPSYTPENFKTLVDDIRARSIYNYQDVTVGPDDKLLALSTCHYRDGTYGQNNNQRFVIYAKLILDEEPEFTETANITAVENPKQPSYW